MTGGVRSIVLMAMTSLLLSGCMKEVQQLASDIEAEPRRNPNDSTSRVLNEMKRPQGAVAPVAVAVEDRDARISALESELARLRSERDRLAARVTELESELAKCRQELAQCRQERDRLASRVKELESQIAQLQGQLAQLEALKTERDRLAAALAASQGLLAAAEIEKNKLRNELDECRSRLRQCEAELDALKKRLAELEARPPMVVEKVVKVPLLEIRADALFDTAKADLKPAGVKVLKSAAEALRKMGINNIKSVRVDGHADSRRIKTKEFPNNQVLSEARARRVAEFLSKESGLSMEKFVIKGHGDAQPIGDNKTAEGQAQNRRVEVTVEQLQ